jgi:shikimate dehydrogenase
MMIDKDTAYYGVAGMPLRHTLSPAMHTAAFRACGLNAAFKTFESTDLKGTIQGMRIMGIKGLAVTIPYKSSVIPFLDRIDLLAGRIGAVNTIVNRGGVLAGYNTDAAGALAALQEVVDPKGKHTVILGAGGAARAIGYILKEQGGELTIASRSRKQGEELARGLDAAHIPLEEIDGMRMDILINATPVGMYPHQDQLPVDPGKVRVNTVMDIVYNPLETELLKKAAALGCRIIPGIRMFIHQGAEQFRLWTGLQAPIQAMEAAVMKALR